MLITFQYLIRFKLKALFQAGLKIFLRLLRKAIVCEKSSVKYFEPT